MMFRFNSIIKKYEKPYVLVRAGDGQGYDEYGDPIPAEPIRVALKGHFQPVSAALQLAEGGNYTADDRALFTAHRHEPGDLIEYQGIQYTIDMTEDRDYRDTNKYIAKKRVVNDPV